MAKTVKTWAQVEKDPGYQALPPEGKQKVKAAFEKTTGKKAASPLRRANPPQQAGPGNAFTEGFDQGFSQNLTGSLLNAATGRQAPESIPFLDAVQGLAQNFQGGGLSGAGEGAMGATGAVLGTLSDPAGLAIDVATLGLGGKAVKAVAPKLTAQAAANLKKAAPVTLAGVSGGIQGGGTSLAQGDTDHLVQNTLMGAAMSGALSAKGKPKAAPVPVAPRAATLHMAPRPLPEPTPINPKVMAARIEERKAKTTNPAEVARLDKKLQVIQGQAPGKPSPITRLIFEEAGEFDPAAIGRLVKNRTKKAQDLQAQQLATGDTAAAQVTGENIEALKDVKAMVMERPAEQSDPNAVTATKYFNPTKYEFASPEAMEKFAGLTRETVAERGWDPKARIPHSVINSRAIDLLGEPIRVDALKDKRLKFGESLNPVEYEAARLTVKNLTEEVVGLEQQLDQLPQSTPPAERDALQSRIHTLEKDIKGFMDVIIPSRSQKGRDLNYLKMVAQHSFDPSFWTARATRLSGGAMAPQTQSRIRQILVEGETANAAGDTAGAREARIRLAQEMARLERTGFQDTITALRKAGLLTGIKTIERNMGGTVAYQALEEVVKVPAAIVDLGLSMVSGNRTVLMPSPMKSARGIYEAGTRGVQEFREVMQHGLPREQLANLEIPKEINSGLPVVGPLINAYTNTVFRFQGAQDRITKAYAFRRSLDDQAILRARNEAPAGPQRDALLQQYRTNPTQEMIAEAIADADFMTFTNDTDIATGVQALRSKLSPNKRFFLDLVLPFVKTPAAVAERILDYAVIGQTGRVFNQQALRSLVEEGLTPQQQKAIALGIGRGAVGAPLIYMGYLLASNGLMTGTYEPDKKEMNEAAGRTPSSIKIGGQWVTIQALSPIGNLLTLGATIHRMHNTPDGEGVGLNTPTAALAAKTVLDQPFTQGMNQVVDLARDPERKGQKFVNSVAGSAIPTLSAEVAQAFDPVDRVVTTPGDAIRKRIPGMRNTLPVKVDPLGRPVEVPTGANAFNAFSGREAKEDSDPIIQEMMAIQPRLSATPKKLKRQGWELELTVDDQAEYRERVGALTQQRMQQLLALPAYQNTRDDDVKRDWMERVLADARQRVKVQMMNENTDRRVRAGVR